MHWSGMLWGNLKWEHTENSPEHVHGGPSLPPQPRPLHCHLGSSLAVPAASGEDTGRMLDLMTSKESIEKQCRGLKTIHSGHNHAVYSH